MTMNYESAWTSNPKHILSLAPLPARMQWVVWAGHWRRVLRPHLPSVLYPLSTHYVT